MRASRRFEGHIWLESLPNDPRPGVVFVQPTLSRSFTTNMDYLTGECALYMLFAADKDGFTMRCYPADRPGSSQATFVAAAYRGKRLSLLPAAAVADYLAFVENASQAKLSQREVERWVE